MFTVLAAFGILSPASRGSLMTAFAFLFAFTGYIFSFFFSIVLFISRVDFHRLTSYFNSIFSGFVTSRLYRMFRDQTPFKLVIMVRILVLSVCVYTTSTHHNYLTSFVSRAFCSRLCCGPALSRCSD